MENIRNLAKILNINEGLLGLLDGKMSAATGRTGVLDLISVENEKLFREAFAKINNGLGDAYHALFVLHKTIYSHEKKLRDFLGKMPGTNNFEKSVELAKRVIETEKGMLRGFFLKKENIAKILKQRPPEHLMEYLGHRDINDLLAKEDLVECFSALRFAESADWMHETFKEAYKNFSAADFEEREIEIRVLSDKWRGLAEKFVAKKHHNVSHLKEFGVIFLNPIEENTPGKFLRDFLLFLHYFHEIDFYSKLFQNCFNCDNFSDHFQSLLRGDVKEIFEVKEGEWLIVQRYLSKDNPDDPRLKLPRINPEAIHWLKGERDFADFFKENGEPDLAFWADLGWVGNFLPLKLSLGTNSGEKLISLDIEDSAMASVSFVEGRGLEQFFTYHQQEAMWTKIFSEYIGGEAAMEKILIENFDKGIIKF